MITIDTFLGMLKCVSSICICTIDSEGEETHLFEFMSTNYGELLKEVPSIAYLKIKSFKVRGNFGGNVITIYIDTKEPVPTETVNDDE